MVPSVVDLITPAGSGASQSAYVTASMAPINNKLLVATVVNTIGTGTATLPTMQGGGITTWTQQDTHTFGSRRITTFRGLTGFSPTTGTATIDFGGVTQSVCAWSIGQVSDSKLTGVNGADAFVQTQLFSALTGSTAVTLTLSVAWSSADNTGYAVGYAANNSTYVAADPTGKTLLGTHGASGRSITSMWGRNGSSLDLGLTASATTGVKLGRAYELAGEPDPTGFQGQRPRISLIAFNGRFN